MLDLSLKKTLVSGDHVFLKGSRFFSFFPHKCTCKKIVAEADCSYIGRTGGPKKLSKNIYWFNCPHCKTTFIKKSEKAL